MWCWAGFLSAGPTRLRSRCGKGGTSPPAGRGGKRTVPIDAVPMMQSVINTVRTVDRSDMPALSRFQARDGTELAYRHYPPSQPATGRIAIVVHGSSVGSPAMHAVSRALAAKGVEAYAVDMRGHGGSAPVAGDYTMDQLASDVKGALDVLEIRKVHYIGLSIGGMIGQGFALANPGYLASLTLCDTQPSTPPGSAASAGLRTRRAPCSSRGRAFAAVRL